MIKTLEGIIKNKSLYMMDMSDYYQLPYHVYLKDTRGIIRECNLSQAKSLGFTKGSDVVGYSEKEFLSLDECKTLRANDTKILKSETPKIIVEKATFVDLVPQNMFSIKAPIRTQAGKIIGIFGISIPLNDGFITGFPNNFFNDYLKPVDCALPNHPSASKREMECLIYLTKGMTAKQIAKLLHLSPRTIEFYIDNLKKKFKCANRTELVAKAFEIL